MIARETCRLRPMTESDLDMVLQWRNREPIRRAMYTDHPISRDEHYAWFERVTREQKTHHFVFEYDSVPMGVINVVDINRTANRCAWGFYVGAEHAPRGTGSAMGFVALEHLFEVMGHHKVIGEVLADNEASLRYHRRLGFTEEGRLVEHVRKGDRLIDVVTFAIFDRDWFQIKERLAGKCFGEGSLNAGH
jgi:UDP-4-amino-4,6-dideoxy-N-acetyl-beta-L-altrosamine N-acetyltransferase